MLFRELLDDCVCECSVGNECKMKIVVGVTVSRAGVVDLKVARVVVK